MMKANGWSRRNFLKTVGASVPTLQLLLQSGASLARGNKASGKFDSSKFTPIDLSAHFTASSTDFGVHDVARSFGGDSAKDALLRTPTGNQRFRGIPFCLGSDSIEDKCWLAMTNKESSWAVQEAQIPIQRKGRFICLASFCDWDANENPKPGDDGAERVGQQLAEAVILYDDGTEAKSLIRRRFEVNAPSVQWGHLSFNSLSHSQDAPRNLSESLRSGSDWGQLQAAVQDNTYGQDVSPGVVFAGSVGTLWISVIANPQPERLIRALRLRSSAEDLLFICAVTLFHGKENPLRTERMCLYRITLPEPYSGNSDKWDIDIDLGVVTRRYAFGEFNPDRWLRAPDAGLGRRAAPADGTHYLYAELAASSDATLSLADDQSGTRYEFNLAEAADGKEVQARLGGARVQLLERDKVWLHCRVLDSGTHQPTPVRIAFRSKDRPYIAPYGHRTEINDAWFEDYGGDVKLMDSSFAYVSGDFKIELPVGEVYVEMTKGFEYTPVRKKLNIESGQRDLNLELSRFANLRAKGWVTADSHVHFLSPSTAILEGEAEGLNLINLLAAQWSDLFTNVADLHQGAITSRSGETLVQVGTENRQHILGHLGLLGAPVFPMSAAGPEESYIGDPLWNSLADWADACRHQGGLVVAPHFPNPNGEIAADIALGKIDAVEIVQATPTFNSLQILDWYRYLNCGYRLPAVGGTDKMGAYMPVGANRTYAYLNGEEFNFGNWAKAVRGGNTFSTTGPLLFFQADGRPPGSEIVMRSGIGTIEVRAEVKSFIPIHRLEIIVNGRVIVSREDRAGTRELSLADNVKVEGPAWLAARCASGLGPTTSWDLAIAAHTSPVYVHVAGKELFSASSAAYMLTLIEGAQMWVANLATRSDAGRFEKIRETFIQARNRLHQQMHDHGIPH
jgi:hypothetical protein